MKRYLFIISVMATSAIMSCGCSKDDNPSAPSTPAPHAAFQVGGQIAGATITQYYIAFTNSSENADTYLWDFGNGQTSEWASSAITYDTSGQYVVTLIARQLSTNRRDTARQTLIVTPGMAVIDSIIVVQIPFTDSNGAPWDPTNGPDLYCCLYREGDLVDCSSPVNDLVPEQLPIGWAPHFQSEREVFYPGWGWAYRNELYDFDDIGDRDFIGSVPFSINGIVTQFGYPSTVDLVGSPQTTVHVTLMLHWQ